MTVISFAALKSVRQLKQHRQDLVAVLTNVRDTLTRLFENGLIFHNEGSRASRDLLEAQENLAEALDAIDALPEDTDERTETARHVQQLLDQVGVLATRATERLQRLTQG
jgi:hypothetical protein